jgi:hypothetical protein
MKKLLFGVLCFLSSVSFANPSDEDIIPEINMDSVYFSSGAISEAQKNPNTEFKFLLIPNNVILIISIDEFNNNKYEHMVDECVEVISAVKHFQSWALGNAPLNEILNIITTSERYKNESPNFMLFIERVLRDSYRHPTSPFEKAATQHFQECLVIENSFYLSDTMTATELKSQLNFVPQ